MFSFEMFLFYRQHMTALMYAARNGRALIVEKLVKHVANIDKQESRGYTVS